LNKIGLAVTAFGAGNPQELEGFLKRQRDHWARIMTGLKLEPQ